MVYCIEFPPYYIYSFSNTTFQFCRSFSNRQLRTLKGYRIHDNVRLIGTIAKCNRNRYNKQATTMMKICVWFGTIKIWIPSLREPPHAFTGKIKYWQFSYTFLHNKPQNNRFFPLACRPNAYLYLLNPQFIFRRKQNFIKSLCASFSVWMRCDFLPTARKTIGGFAPCALRSHKPCFSLHFSGYVNKITPYSRDQIGEMLVSKFWFSVCSPPDTDSIIFIMCVV